MTWPTQGVLLAREFPHHTGPIDLPFPAACAFSSRPAGHCRRRAKPAEQPLRVGDRVWKTRSELQAHSRFAIQDGCGLPVATGAVSTDPVTPHYAAFASYKAA
jgi:hypothetical protein